MKVTIRLVVPEDTADFTSQTLERYAELPHLYIPVEAIDIPLPPFAVEMGVKDLMRAWGPANAQGDGSVAVYERLYPGSVVAPRDMGQFVHRADLLYHGAELAADHVAALQSKPGSTAFE